MPKHLETQETEGEIRIRIQLDECLPAEGDNVREFVYGKGPTFDEGQPVPAPQINAARCLTEVLALCEEELASRPE